MGKKVLKLFLDTLLRAAVILLGIAIIVMLVLLVKTMSKSKKSDEAGTSSVIVTEQTDPADPTFSGDGSEATDTELATDASSEEAVSENAADIVVINASGVSGVAGSWKTVLNADGYGSVEVGNYLGDVLSYTTVYVSGDYTGSSLTGMFSNAGTAQKSELDSSMFDVDIDSFDIVIVVGEDNAANN